MSKYLSLLFFLVFIGVYSLLLHNAAEEKFKVFNDVQQIKEQMESVNGKIDTVQERLDKCSGK